MERILATSPLITKLSFPSVVDVSNGTVRQNFSIELAPGAMGAGTHVLLTFDYVGQDMNLGEGGVVNDGFDDATPNYASSGYDFSSSNAAGDYTIRTLYLWDDEGHWADYSGADLKAMNLPSSFTVIDHNAPAAPTISVHAAASGLIEGDRVVLSGTAGANQEVTVNGLHEDWFTGPLGTVKADAQGHWSLTSYELGDGHFTQVVAVATDPQTGKVSTYSAPVSFYVQAAPSATQVNIAHGADGTVNAAKPLIWGRTGNIDNDTVIIYDNGKAIATVQAGDDGWWGFQSATLASGAHQFTATVEDKFGQLSPLSAAVDVRAVATPAAGISYSVGSLDNQTSQTLDVNKLQAALDAAAALTSSVIDGTQDIVLKVYVGPLSDDRFIASSGSDFHRGVDGAMPTLTGARLNLSQAFAQTINDAKSLSGYDVVVLAHEMLHVLGVEPSQASLFEALTRQVGEDAYFTGQSARSINGGDVLLSSDHGHIAAPYDLISPSFSNFFPYFGQGPSSPYSALDLAILRDLGYRNTDTIVSNDGSRYIAGDGKAGHDTVTGRDSRDTLYIYSKAAEYTVKATDAGYTAADNSGVNGTLKLSNIERIYFNDKAMALDVGAGENAGMAYRMYQAAFNRAPDNAGLSYWIDQLDRGLSLQGLAHQFSVSQEFASLYGDQLSDVAYLTRLYANVLHRAPDQAGLDYWVATMKAPGARETALADFSESAENVAQLVGTLHNGFTYGYTYA
jgi:hypothetical protein